MGARRAGLLAVVVVLLAACGGKSASSASELTDEARTSLETAFGIELPADVAERVCVPKEADAVTYMLSIGARDFENGGSQVPAKYTAGWVAGRACPEIRNGWALDGLREMQDECDAMPEAGSRTNPACESLRDLNEAIIEQAD